MPYLSVKIDKVFIMSIWRNGRRSLSQGSGLLIRTATNSGSSPGVAHLIHTIVQRNEYHYNYIFHFTCL